MAGLVPRSGRLLPPDDWITDGDEVRYEVAGVQQA
jgi:hypothetical protein